LVVASARAFPTAPGTAPLLGDKFCRLLLDEGLLQAGQDGSGFGQGKPEGIGSQRAAFQARHFLQHLPFALV
jgi:hypothetical protein